jgi:hypothetical protein
MRDEGWVEASEFCWLILHPSSLIPPMNDHVAALFYQAADLPPDERRALLDAACRGDPDLRAEVERLLAQDSRLGAEEGAGAFLDSPLVRLPKDEGGSGKDESSSTSSSDSSLILHPSRSSTTAFSACSAKAAWVPSTRRSRTTRADRSPSR